MSEDAGTAYNIVFPVRMVSERALNVDALRRALLALVRRHAALRTRYGEIYQEVLTPAEAGMDFAVRDDVAGRR